MISDQLHRLNKQINVHHPIIQAPMAGGATTPELVAAVSNAGALGSFAAALLPPEQMKQQVQRIRQLTDRPFGVNMFILKVPLIDSGPDGEPALFQAQSRLYEAHQLLEVPLPPLPATYCHDNEKQMQCLLELAPPVVSFTFNVLSAERVQAFQSRGCLVIGTATNLEEAICWQDAGANAICAQGSEAGGHRGTFIGDFEQSNIGLMALLATLKPRMRVPLIAAGGIMNGQAIIACQIMGADMCQMGTAFLNCPESGIHPAYKLRLADATDKDTRLTRLFSGKYARGIVNDFMRRMQDDEQLVPEYPIQNALTGPMRQAAAKQNNTDYMSLWAGQGVDLIRTMPAAELIRQLVEEMKH